MSRTHIEVFSNIGTISCKIFDLDGKYRDITNNLGVWALISMFYETIYANLHSSQVIVAFVRYMKDFNGWSDSSVSHSLCI